jgi:hypothetical protein
VRFRDSSGNYGPVATVATSGAQVLQFANIAVMQEDDEFSGTFENVFSYGGKLLLGSGEDAWAYGDVWSSPDMWTVSGRVVALGRYNFATGIDLVTVKNVRLRRDILMQGFRVDSDIWGVADAWSSSDLWQSATEDVDVQIEVSLTNDDPANTSAVWSDYGLLESHEITTRGIRASAGLTTTDSLVTPIVERLRVYADEVSL